MSGLYTLKGELTMATVPALFANSGPEFSGETLTIDMNAVERTDSAGLALLLEWVRLVLYQMLIMFGQLGWISIGRLSRRLIAGLA